MRTSFLALLVLFALAVAPLRAQELGEVPLSSFSYSGVVQQVTPGGVWLQTSNGVNVMLPQGLSFEVGGVQVGIGGLTVGQPATVL
ncbi:MAG: hypothetical protein AB1758_06485, partial [Candidatus Eremiobacterota bacterium]